MVLMKYVIERYDDITMYLRYHMLSKLDLKDLIKKWCFFLIQQDLPPHGTLDVLRNELKKIQKCKCCKLHFYDKWIADLYSPYQI